MERFACVNQDTCRLRDTIAGCREDIHHTFYPRHDYKKEIAREFRNLPENKVRICRALHEEIHATQEPPEQPPIEEMKQAINEHRIGRFVMEMEE